jgi:legumain
MLNNGTAPPTPAPEPPEPSPTPTPSPTKALKSPLAASTAGLALFAAGTGSNAAAAKASAASSEGSMGSRSDKSDGPSHRHHGRHAAQRDADLLPLIHAAARAPCPRRRAAAAAELSSAVARRRGVNGAARAAAAVLMALPRTAPALLALAGVDAGAADFDFDLDLGAMQQQQGVESTGGLVAARRRLHAMLGADADQHVEAVVGDIARAPAGRRKGAALVDDWGCLRAMVAAWEGSCGRMDQYAMRHTRLMANLCNAKVEPHELAGALRGSGACSGAGQLLA